MEKLLVTYDETEGFCVVKQKILGENEKYIHLLDGSKCLKEYINCDGIIYMYVNTIYDAISRYIDILNKKIVEKNHQVNLLRRKIYSIKKHLIKCTELIQYKEKRIL